MGVGNYTAAPYNVHDTGTLHDEAGLLDDWHLTTGVLVGIE